MWLFRWLTDIDTSIILPKKVRPGSTTLVSRANLPMKRSNFCMRTFLSTRKLSSLVPLVFFFFLCVCVMGGVVHVWWCPVQFSEIWWLAVVLPFFFRFEGDTQECLWDYYLNWPLPLWENYLGNALWLTLSAGEQSPLMRLLPQERSVQSADQIRVLCRYIICHFRSQ